MDSAWELEAAVSKYLEVLGLRQPDALSDATQALCSRVRHEGGLGDELQRAIALARSWVIAFCKERDEQGQVWLDVPTALAKWPMTFACSDPPAGDVMVDTTLVTPARAALPVHEQELDTSFASLAMAANSVFQNAAFTVLQWARLRE
jgi:hypothetical protein